jgi:hypothetical protein
MAAQDNVISVELEALTSGSSAARLVALVALLVMPGCGSDDASSNAGTGGASAVGGKGGSGAVTSGGGTSSGGSSTGGTNPGGGNGGSPGGGSAGAAAGGSGGSTGGSAGGGGAPGDKPFFAWEGKSASDLNPWINFDLGVGTIAVSTQPNGGNSPGIVRVVTDPLDPLRKAVEATVTPTAHASPASSTDSVYLWNPIEPYLGHDGQDIWEYFEIIFPDSFAPAAGQEANPWLVEHHNDSNYVSQTAQIPCNWEYAELVWGVFTDGLAGTSPSGAVIMRIKGGNSDGCLQLVNDYTTGTGAAYIPVVDPIAKNHRYTFLAHVIWSPDPTKGMVECWVDGALRYSKNVSTLYKRPDGTLDTVNFEENNYRPHATVNSTVYYGTTRIGPTKASVSY